MGKRKRGAGAGAASGAMGGGGQKKKKKGKTVHLCAVCLYETDRKSRLTVHMRTHTGVVLILTLTLTLTSVTFDRGYCMISVSYGTDENTIIIDMPHVVSKPTRIYYVLVSKVCTYPGKL